MSAVSRTDICLTSAAGQAAGQTSASSVMLRVHCLTGFDMGIRGCQGQQLQIDAGSSLNRKEQKRENYTFWRQSIEKPSNVPGCPDGSSICLVKGSGHKGSACKTTHEMHKRSLVGLLLAGLLERNCARMYQRAKCSHAVGRVALQLCPCCLEDQCLMGLPQNLYRKAQKNSMQCTVHQSTVPGHLVVAGDWTW